jgi:hypothetical protein
MAALKSGVTLKGGAGLTAALARLNDRLKGQAPAVVSGLARYIIDDAKSLTPVDTGALRESGYVDAVKVAGSRTTVEMGFGGDDVTSKYALIQHENDEYEHAIGQAHYFLDAIDLWVPSGAKSMAALLRVALRGG